MFLKTQGHARRSNLIDALLDGSAAQRNNSEIWALVGATLLDMGQRESRSRYDAMVSSHLEEPRRMFRKHQCGWLVLNTDDDPVDVLGRELRVLIERPS